MTDPARKHWLMTACVPVKSSDIVSQVASIPVPISMPIHIGNQVSHSSHSLKKYKGLIYCNKCGARAAGTQMKYLAKQCLPPTTMGRRTLACIKSGRLPSGLTEWPE